MKEKNKNREIENLFRKNFSGYEARPSAGFWNGFSKKLKTREFLRFNAGRFNIWYLGAVVVTAIVAASLTFINPDDGITGNDSIMDLQTTLQINEISNDVQVQLSPEKSEKLSKGSPGASGRVTTVKARSETDQNRGVNDSADNKLKSTGDYSFSEKLIENFTVKTNKLVRQSPSSEFSVNVSSGCIPLQVIFENHSANYDSCIWEFGDGGYSDIRSPVWVFDEKGDYQVTLVIFGENGQTAASRQTIIVHPQPEARFEISSGDAVIPEEEVHFFNYSDRSVSWEWSFGDGAGSASFEPDHTYKKPGSYSVKLIVRSEHGCLDSMTVTNAFDDNSCYLKFPNAFIPNKGGPTGGYYSNWSDEQSEVFHPVWSGVTQYQLRIFSRMGILVFETNDINIGWDGYIKGEKADPGVYIWKVRGVFKNGDPFVQGGDVTILPK